jgi:hypothetical protein
MRNPICRRLTDLLCRTLEPDEHAAVVGDLAESRTRDAQALRDVFGLVARRQVILWKRWRPWLALLGLVLIAGVTLRPVALRIVGAVGFRLWSYAIEGTALNNGLTPGEEAFLLLSFFLALLFWSWTWGFVLGSLSGGVIWSTGALFCAVMFAPLIRGLLFLKMARAPEMLLPQLLILLILALNPLFPLFAGVRQGLKVRKIERSHAWRLAVAVTLLTSLVTWTGGWYGIAHETWSHGQWRGAVPFWPERLAWFLMLGWPAAYMILTARPGAQFEKSKAVI